MDIPDVISPLIESGRPWVERYGLIAVCVGLCAETLVFTGFIAPGYGILVAAGFFIAAGVLPWWPTILLAWLGATIGDQMSYLAGYYFGHRLLRKKGPVTDRLRSALEQESYPLLLLYHYAPTFRVIVPCIAGSVRYNIVRWIFVDTIGVLIWILLTIGIGYATNGMLRQQGNLLANMLHAVGAILMIGITWKIHIRLKQTAISGR